VGESASAPTTHYWDSTYSTHNQKIMHDINKKLIKKTHKKLVISGNTAELYIFERPLFYNNPGQPLQNSSEKNTSEERRFSSIKRSRDKIRRLCNANAYHYGNCVPKFLTLTFRDEITDLKEARRLFKIFIAKLQYRYPNTKYLGVAEIQKQRYATYGKKVWHFHIIFFNLPFIYGIQSVFETLWPYGFLKINAISHVKNVGAYVSKYLRKDLYEKELFGEKSFFTSKGLHQPKTYRKEVNVEKHLQSLNTKLEYEHEYESSTHGKIIYKVLTFNQHANTIQ
jgi:hypothetical protein